MNKNYYFLLISLLLWVCSGCQEERSIQPLIKQVEIDSVTTITAPPRDTVAIDSLNVTPAKRLVRKTTTTKKVVKKVIRPADEVEVDIYPSDPFEDPDYIGTPCGDYIDGKCTRHAQCRK